MLARTPDEESDEKKGPAYCYDGLDRRDRRIDEVEFQADGDRFAEHKTACADKPEGASARDYSYLGMGEQLARSSEPAAKADGEPTDPDAPGEQESKTYDYTADGVRLGQKAGDESQSTGFRAYDLDAQDSVVGLESNGEADDPAGGQSTAGEVAEEDEYRYDPFGQALNTPAGEDDQEGEPGTPEGGLSAEAAANPFRFQGHYQDADTGLYDMQARSYDPGQGRFLSQDVFQDPQADLALASDPLTNDRYAFTAGNPTTRSEYDGHCPDESICEQNSRDARAVHRAAKSGDNGKLRKAARTYGTIDTPAVQRRLSYNGQEPAARSRQRYVASLSPNDRTLRSKAPPGYNDGSVDKYQAEQRVTPGPEARKFNRGVREAVDEAVPDNVSEGIDTAQSIAQTGTPQGNAETAQSALRLGRRFQSEGASYTAGYLTPTLAIAAVTRKTPVLRGTGGKVADSTTIVRGGQSDVPVAGETFSGSQGATLDQAAAGVPHGTIRSTTAGQIRAGGGTVEHAPEFNSKVGRTNNQHVDVCVGPGSCPFGSAQQNPVPKSRRFGGRDYPYDDR